MASGCVIVIDFLSPDKQEDARSRHRAVMDDGWDMWRTAFYLLPLIGKLLLSTSDEAYFNFPSPPDTLLSRA